MHLGRPPGQQPPVIARATTRRAANVASEVGTICHSASTDVGVRVVGVIVMVVLVRVVVVVVVVVVVAVQAEVGTCLVMVILATCNLSRDARPAACTGNRTGLVGMDASCTWVHKGLVQQDNACTK